MHWSAPLLCLVTGGLAALQADKHYAIMDNDWYTAGFVPYLIALDGDVEILGLASGEYSTLYINFHSIRPPLTQSQTRQTAGKPKAPSTPWQP
jgi:hypothetical protein